MVEDHKSDDRDRQDRALPPGETGLATVNPQLLAPATPIYYPEEEEIHLKEHLRILRRYAWVILTFFTITLLTTIVWTFTQHPLYTATATIKIEPEELRIVQYQPVRPADFRQEDYYKTQYQIIRSRSLARRVIDRLDLAEHPEFQPGPPGWWDELKARLRFGLRDWLARLGLVLPQHPAPVDEAGAGVRSPPVGAFLARTRVEPVRGTRLLNVSFESGLPSLAALVANTIADTYVLLNVEQRLGAGRYARQFLSEQLEETRTKLKEVELRLAEFLQKEDIVVLPGAQQGLTVKYLYRLSDALLQARTEQMEKGLLLVQTRGLALDLFPSVLENQYVATLKSEILKQETQYRELRETYKPRHPKMARLRIAIEGLRLQLRNEVRNVVDRLEVEYEAAGRREEEIEGVLTAERRKAQQENRGLVQYSILKREVDTNREIYSSLLQRLKETDVTSALTVSNVQVVERALAPGSPSRPRKRRNLLLGAVVGLMGGVGLAFFFAYMNTKLRSPEEVERALQLPTLGSIPALWSLERTEDGQGPFALITYNRAQSTVSEFFRRFRTAILFSSPDHPPRSLLFTSLQPGEGKTSVALNTAISLAQLGREVLVIDTDLRQPALHLLLNLEAKPGLSEFLTGQAELAEVLRATEVAGLYAIPAGHLPVNPADLLSSSRIDSMLETMTQRFRHVVIDTPPILGFSDSLILAPRVEAVILVVQDGRIEREWARRAVGLLRGVRARLLGVVVNQTDLRGGGTYGYAYYPYYHSYGTERT